MAEARQRSLKKVEILASATRCVYCDHVGTYELEHMPPRGMFANKDRPSGWEFACCERCNKGTRGADALAIFMAQTEAITEDNWKLPNIIKLRGAIASHAPGVLNELFGMSKWDDSFINHNGIIRPIKVGRVCKWPFDDKLSKYFLRQSRHDGIYALYQKADGVGRHNLHRVVLKRRDVRRYL